jgi:hypothetical protein
MRFLLGVVVGIVLTVATVASVYAVAALAAVYVSGGSGDCAKRLAAARAQAKDKDGWSVVEVDKRGCPVR